MTRPMFDKAVARRAIMDITEETPIPRGAVVLWCDYDQAADLYFVEYENRVYAAQADELIIRSFGLF